MKTITKLSLVVLLAASVSCHSDLDIIQNDRLSSSNMWKTSEQVEGSTVNIYAQLRGNFVQSDINVLHWGELRVGSYMWGYSHLYKVYTASEVLMNIMTSSSSSCGWTHLYATIDQANAVLKYAPLESIPMTDAKRSWAIGQAAFARAYCYFWAARIWGDVPLNLLPIESVNQDETYPVRAPQDEVYGQIGKDIELAMENANNLGSNKYMATKDAVLMLKAEYALWMYSTRKGGDKWLDEADEALGALGVAPGDSRLLKNYGDIFDGYGKNNKNSAEVIFALYNSQSEKLTGGYPVYFTYATPGVKTQFHNNPVPIGGTQWLDYGDGYLALMRDSRDKNGDTRVKTNLGDGVYGMDENQNGGVLTWPAKFIGDCSSGRMVCDADLLYYRYGLAAMMMAELRYFQGRYSDALTYLNMIAGRAYGNDKFYTSATKESVLQALCNEYFLEFPCEGVIWWALIRLDKIWDYNPDLAARKNDTNILLWPISKSARNKNSKLVQTAGWY